VKRPPPRSLTSAEEFKLFSGLAVQPFLAALVALVSFPYVMLDRDGRLGGAYLFGGAATGLAFGVGIFAVVLTVVAVFANREAMK